MTLQVDGHETLRLIPTSIDVPFTLNRTVADKLPHFIDLVPFKNAIEITVGEVGPWYIYRLEDVAGRMQSIARYLTPDEKKAFEAVESHLNGADGLVLAQLLGSSWVAWNKFTYVGLTANCKELASFLNPALLKWANQVMLPSLDQIHQARTKRFLPPQIEIDFIRVANAIWVLESEKECRQGTAFYLSGTGMVTCAHVLARDTVAFQPNSAAKRYPVSIVRKHDVIDLAVVQIDDPEPVYLSPAPTDEVSILSPIAVAGFPNYRVGDSGRFVTGAVSGFRVHSGIRRVLVDAAIVAGNSGGPVLDKRGAVVGVAVTGADNDSSVSTTENHAFIPIGAFSFFA